MSRSYLAREGFTLSEILIALALMGVIALMTVPKVLVSQQTASLSPRAKDVIFMMQAAYNEYQTENAAGNGTTLAHITPYLNYVKVNTTATIDQVGSVSGCGGTVPSTSCSEAGHQCLVLPNGAYIKYNPTTSFNGTGSLNALPFLIDPDGKYANNGSLSMFLYFNGNTKSVGHIDPGTVNSAGTNNPDMSYVPDWFDWK